MRTLFYRLVNLVCRYLVLPLYTRIEVYGLENVPPNGPLIIASNHLNDGDPGIICTRISRRIVFMAKAELFRYPVLKQFMDCYGFPVRRGEADLTALRRASETLKQGLALCIFPEGTRSGAVAALGEAWPGAGLIAMRSEAPVLPVAITGSQYLGLPGLFLHVLKRHHVVLRIGEPFRLPRAQRLNAQTAKAGADLIMERIAALLPDEYRGYYGKERVATDASSAPSPATALDD
jgi:1-acyl-sn-glycerol-3-phosphate acyltransferase